MSQAESESLRSKLEKAQHVSRIIRLHELPASCYSKLQLFTLDGIICQFFTSSFRMIDTFSALCRLLLLIVEFAYVPHAMPLLLTLCLDSTTLRLVSRERARDDNKISSSSRLCDVWVNMTWFRAVLGTLFCYCRDIRIKWRGLNSINVSRTVCKVVEEA